jgi:drug/metabolite transporter (DMT)-like permease
MHTTTALNAILMLSLVPATILVGGALSGASRPSTMQWAGTTVSLLGAGILITRGSLDALLGLDLVRGDLWMIVGVLLWTAYSLLLRRRPADLPPDVALMASIVPAIGALLPVALLSGSAALPAPTPFVIGAVLYIAIFASLIAFSLWAYGVAVIGPERAGQYVHLMPIFGAVLSTLLLGETIVAAQLAGAAFVFAGLFLVQRQASAPPVAGGVRTRRGSRRSPARAPRARPEIRSGAALELRRRGARAAPSLDIRRACRYARASSRCELPGVRSNDSEARRRRPGPPVRVARRCP